MKYTDDIHILVNGAGGNNPKGTTSKEYLTKEDIINKLEGVTTFFDLDPAGVSFVFNLNFLGTLLPTQVFAKDMVAKKKGRSFLRPILFTPEQLCRQQNRQAEQRDRCQ